MQTDSDSPEKKPACSERPAPKSEDDEFVQHCLDFPAMEEADALRYLRAHGFLNGSTVNDGRFLGAAMNFAAMLRYALTERMLNHFLTAVYFEETGDAEDLILTAYWRADRFVPEHIKALAGIERTWTVFLDLTASLLDRSDPGDPYSNLRIDDLKNLIKGLMSLGIPA